MRGAARDAQRVRARCRVARVVAGAIADGRKWLEPVEIAVTPRRLPDSDGAATEPA